MVEREGREHRRDTLTLVTYLTSYKVRPWSDSTIRSCCPNLMSMYGNMDKKCVIYYLATPAIQLCGNSYNPFENHALSAVKIVRDFEMCRFILFWLMTFRAQTQSSATPSRKHSPCLSLSVSEINIDSASTSKWPQWQLMTGAIFRLAFDRSQNDQCSWNETSKANENSINKISWDGLAIGPRSNAECAMVKLP